MGYKHQGYFSEQHRKRISRALKKAGIRPPSRKGIYKDGKPFDRKAYMKVYNVKYYAKNPEYHKSRTKLWWINRDKIKVRARNRKWQTEKIKTDMNFRLALLFRRRIGMAIKVNLGKKAYKTIELLGCSVDEACKYLESQFRDGMSWKTYGIYGWHIDHKIPLYAFDLTKPEEQKKAFHYTNLQPLFALENLKKNKKMI